MKMSIQEIIYGCWLGGCTLEQRLATIDGYGPAFPRLVQETALIREHLARPRTERDAIFLKAIRARLTNLRQ